MTSTGNQANLGTSPPMSYGDWAAARYNWYRACGLLDDPRRIAQIATYQKSPDPLPPRPHLKWYPLNKPDVDVASTYQRPVESTQHDYSQRAEDAQPGAFLSPNQAGEAENPAGDDRTRSWSRGDWAAARYNWYRACGLLNDSVPQTAETTRYQKSSESSRPKPHLKWYPLSKPDHDVTTYQQPITATLPAAPGRHYSQRVSNPHARAMLAQYRAQKQLELRTGSSGILFDESKHPRDRIGRFAEKGQERATTTTIGETSTPLIEQPSAIQAFTAIPTSPLGETVTSEPERSTKILPTTNPR